MKHSKTAIKRIVEQAVSAECNLAERDLWLCIDEVQTSGKPVSKILIWATLHYLPAGSPFRSCDPNETLWLFEGRLEEVCKRVQHSFGLRQTITLDFAAINANIHQGVIDLEQVYLSALMGTPCDLNASSTDGITPLMCYASGELADHTIVDLLLRRGADPTLRDKQGHTALDHAHTARSSEKMLIISLLEDALNSC